jgi:alkylation response protein AidB-like acyl-CoA dehydrogenase
VDLNFNLSPDEKSLREEIIAFARAHLNEGAIDRDRDQRFPADLWKQCGELGLQGLLTPSEHGGRGLTPLQAALAVEALGYGCRDGGLSFAICAHLFACVVPIVRHGTDDQKRRWLPGLSDGSLIAANAMSEPSTGSDAFALSTSAAADDGGFRLDGHKTFASNAPVADLIITYAATDAEKGFHGGITCLLVPANTPGVKVGKPVEKMALRTCPMGDVMYDAARLPNEAVLGKVGGGSVIFAESMEWERVCLTALHIGAMERILEDTIAHARARSASGKSVGKFQAVAHRIADMKVRLEAARLLVYRAATTLGATRESGLAASVAKLFASESLLSSAGDAVRNLGGSGVLVEKEAERALRDAVAATIYSGTSDIQRNIIARWLGL